MLKVTVELRDFVGLCVYLWRCAVVCLSLGVQVGGRHFDGDVVVKLILPRRRQYSPALRLRCHKLRGKKEVVLIKTFIHSFYHWRVAPSIHSSILIQRSRGPRYFGQSHSAEEPSKHGQSTQEHTRPSSKQRHRI